MSKLSSLTVVDPGILSLLQDAGRFGQHHIGLTTGGPLDPEAFYWANRLCDNKNLGSACIEISVGGLKLRANGHTRIAVTGANMPLSINGQQQELWRSHTIRPNDTIELGYSDRGVRAYLAVSGGFQVEPSFGSCATVIREGIGGIDGDKLQAHTELPCFDQSDINHTGEIQHWRLPESKQPQYHKQVTLRVIPGYQEKHFSSQQQRLFFHNTYRVSQLCDRMGYRLEGPRINADIEGILSEGICLGAIQVPADGQPIILMNDRQTIGGYPKIGSVLSIDLALLAQLMPGDKINFAAITINCAHNILHLADYRRRSIQLEAC